MKNYSSKVILENKIEQLRKLLKQDICYLFEEYFDLYYLTGLKLSKGALLIGEKVCLFVDGRYFFSAKENFHYEVYPLELMGEWFQKNLIKEIAFDGEKTTYSRYLVLKKIASASSFLLTVLPNPLKKIRMIKAPDEIEKMEKSAQLNQEGVCYIVSLLKEGIAEKELAKAYEVFCLERGAQKLSFDPIIAFGINSAMPHHRASDAILKEGDIVLIDVGVVVDDYASDVTRTVCFGKINDNLYKIREGLIFLQKDLLSHIKPGLSIKALDQKARDGIKAFGDYKCLHSLGHGVGLEVHEYPRISIQSEEDVVLQENMVITIEPGIYVEGLGGVRQEDTIVISENGYKNFYKNLEFATVKF